MAVDRFATPLYSVSEASRYLGVSDSTVRAWATGYTRRSPDRADVRGEPVVTTISGQPASDGFAELRHLPGYERARVVADPRHGFGQPTFVAGGARVEDALGLFWAGETSRPSRPSTEFQKTNSRMRFAWRPV